MGPDQVKIIAKAKAEEIRSGKNQVSPTGAQEHNNGGQTYKVEPNPDPWKHRSSGMKCKTCMWFVPKTVIGSPVYDIGRCRRHAPTTNGYPVVYPTDFCGDHRIDETKL